MTKTSHGKTIIIITLSTGIFLYLGLAELGTFLEQLTYLLLGNMGLSPTAVVVTKNIVNVATVLVGFYFIIKYIGNNLKVTWEATRKLFLKSIAFFIAGVLLSMLSTMLPELMSFEYSNWMSQYSDEVHSYTIAKLKLINTVAWLTKTICVILMLFL